MKPEWARPQPELDLSDTLPGYSTVLLDSIVTFYETGELRVPSGTPAFTAFSCWNDLHLVPPLPALLSSSDQDSLASLVQEACQDFLAFYEEPMKQLCWAECSTLAVAVPVLSVPAARLAMESLHAAVEASTLEGPANASLPLSPPWASIEQGKAALSRLLQAAPGASRTPGYDAACDNILQSEPLTVGAACEHADRWMRRARQTTLLARSAWAQHMFLRALAGQSMWARLEVVTIGRNAEGVYAFGDLAERVSVGWWEWTSPSGAGWKIPSGVALVIHLQPHWACGTS